LITNNEELFAKQKFLRCYTSDYKAIFSIILKLVFLHLYITSSPTNNAVAQVTVYEIFTLRNHALSMHWAAIFAPLCNSITSQLIVLESCSTPQKMG